MKHAKIAMLAALYITGVFVGTQVQAEVPPNVPKNIRYQSAAACQGLHNFNKDSLAFRANGLSLINFSQDVVSAVCSPVVDVSDNGTDEVGLYVSNNEGTVEQTVTCVLTYNTAGLGPRESVQSVTVPAGTIRKVGWNTEGIIFGGPVSLRCALKFRTGVMRVYSISQHSS